MKKNNNIDIFNLKSIFTFIHCTSKGTNSIKKLKLNVSIFLYVINCLRNTVSENIWWFNVKESTLIPESIILNNDLIQKMMFFSNL